MDPTKVVQVANSRRKRGHRWPAWLWLGCGLVIGVGSGAQVGCTALREVDDSEEDTLPTLPPAVGVQAVMINSVA